MKNENTNDRRGLTSFLLIISCILLIAAAAFSFLPLNGEEEIYDNMIRLHVIADSDSEEDQTLKLSVRDSVLETVSSLPESYDVVSASERIVSAEPEIKKNAEAVLREKGCSDEVRVLFDREKYPIRYYDNFVLPAGEYLSLRVVIGSGAGHNWWCVLFPPLCTAVSEAQCEEEFIAAGFTGEQYRMIKKDSAGKYKVKFKILEVLSEAFGFDY